jgi:hypothetical protein
MNEAFRTEKDAMGEVRVPAERLWGAQTQRSIGNVPIGVPRFRWDRPVIRAFGIVKLASARANAKLGVLAADKAQLIERPPARSSTPAGSTPVPAGRVQTGPARIERTRTGIANRAIQLAAGRSAGRRSANGDVNRSQSSNDAFRRSRGARRGRSTHGCFRPSTASSRRRRQVARSPTSSRHAPMDATPVTPAGDGRLGAAGEARRYVVAARCAPPDRARWHRGGHGARAPGDRGGRRRDRGADRQVRRARQVLGAPAHDAVVNASARCGRSPARR